MAWLISSRVKMKLILFHSLFFVVGLLKVIFSFCKSWLTLLWVASQRWQDERQGEVQCHWMVWPSKRQCRVFPAGVQAIRDGQAWVYYIDYKLLLFAKGRCQDGSTLLEGRTLYWRRINCIDQTRLHETFLQYWKREWIVSEYSHILFWRRRLDIVKYEHFQQDLGWLSSRISEIARIKVHSELP